MIDYNFDSAVVVPKALDELGDIFECQGNGMMNHKLIQFIQRFLWLPEPQLQLPIIACYLCGNTELLRQKKLKVPYLFHHGNEGSGKSTVAIIAKLLHDMPIFAADSSASGIRQELEELKKLNRITRFLLWDDLNSQSFEGDDGRKKLSIFKSGYDPLTGTVVMGGKEGKSIKMDIYGLKIFSSCYPFHSSTAYVELIRRCLIIQHKSSDSWFGDSIEEFDWDGCSRRFEELWLPGHGAHVRFEDAFSRIKPLLAKAELKSRKKVIAPAIILTGVAANIFSSLEEGLEVFQAFCGYEESAHEEKSSFEQWLNNWILVHGKSALHLEKRNTSVHFFSSKDVIEAAETAYNGGEFMEKPSREMISSFLLDGKRFGYTLLAKAKAQKYYQEAIWVKEVRNG